MMRQKTKTTNKVYILGGEEPENRPTRKNHKAYYISCITLQRTRLEETVMYIGE